MVELLARIAKNGSITFQACQAFKRFANTGRWTILREISWEEHLPFGLLMHLLSYSFCDCRLFCGKIWKGSWESLERKRSPVSFWHFIERSWKCKQALLPNELHQEVNNTCCNSNRTQKQWLINSDSAILIVVLVHGWKFTWIYELRPFIPFWITGNLLYGRAIALRTGNNAGTIQMKHRYLLPRGIHHNSPYGNRQFLKAENLSAGRQSLL